MDFSVERIHEKFLPRLNVQFLADFFRYLRLGTSAIPSPWRTSWNLSHRHLSILPTYVDIYIDRISVIPIARGAARESPCNSRASRPELARRGERRQGYLFASDGNWRSSPPCASLSSPSIASLPARPWRASLLPGFLYPPPSDFCLTFSSLLLARTRPTSRRGTPPHR
jgi:hypothetical protein